jgi:uncharacterized RDD family membrane protein YckC
MSKNKLAVILHRKPRHFHAHETARFDALSGVQLASFRQRAWAIVIDMAIVGVAQLLLGLHGCSHGSHELGPITFAGLLMMVAHKVESLMEFTLYFAVMLKLGKGQTPGKRLMKARVVSLTHEELSWWQSIERGLGYGASLLEGGFGFVQFFFARNQQCVHDRIAETIVVDERPSAKRLMDESTEKEVMLLP